VPRRFAGSEYQVCILKGGIVIKTHGSKAKYFDLGRPEYPDEFINFLFTDFGIKKTDIIADIGCGTGKIAKHFLDRGNNVFGVEYDRDMLDIAVHNLRNYPNFKPIIAPAENTGLESSSIDYIICGNSYCWFDRTKAVPEFMRISRDGASAFIAVFGGGIDDNFYSDLSIVNDKYRQPVTAGNPDTSPPFSDDNFIEKSFKYIIHDDKMKFINAALSLSYAPIEESEMFKPFYNEVAAVFDKHASDGLLEVGMTIHCVIGKIKDLKTYD